ncbi:MAG: CDP-diacylglycerol--glycerol-3-phosphate 3-phosphatidyltransferase [Blastocatellia bacterium]|nr:CDP-diacylglycerol--glycerol-3-phosphate 3-phosphatidyltransferase [Blastocatellia bacterium]
MNLPNTLTLSRIFIVPLLVAALMTELSERWFGIPRQIFGVTLFLSASFTDWLDGYLARRHGQVTTLGTLLDPIADKLLISSALIALVENRLAPGWAVVIIIGREFAVTGLRTIASQEGLTIGASKMGKFKMLSQVVAITLLMLGSVHGGPPPLAEQTSLFAVQNAFETLFSQGSFTLLQLQQISYGLGRFVMWTVVISAIWSMVNYFKDFYGAVSDRIEQRKRPPLPKIGEAIRTRFRRRPRPPKQRPLPPTEADKA